MTATALFEDVYSSSIFSNFSTYLPAEETNVESIHLFRNIFSFSSNLGSCKQNSESPITDLIALHTSIDNLFIFSSQQATF